MGVQCSRPITASEIPQMEGMLFEILEGLADNEKEDVYVTLVPNNAARKVKYNLEEFAARTRRLDSEQEMKFADERDGSEDDSSRWKDEYFFEQASDTMDNEAFWTADQILQLKLET